MVSVTIFGLALVCSFADLLVTLAQSNAGSDQFGLLRRRFENRLWTVGPPLVIVTAALLSLAVTGPRGRLFPVPECRHILGCKAVVDERGVMIDYIPRRQLQTVESERY